MLDQAECSKAIAGTADPYITPVQWEILNPGPWTATRSWFIRNLCLAPLAEGKAAPRLKPSARKRQIPHQGACCKPRLQT